MSCTDAASFRADLHKIAALAGSASQVAHEAGQIYCEIQLRMAVENIFGALHAVKPTSDDIILELLTYPEKSHEKRK